MLNKHLITGITGQDGLFLTSIILKNNPKDLIVGISRNSENSNFFNRLRYLLPDFKNFENIQLINTDLKNKVEVDKLLTDFIPDYVYNLSGPSSVYKSLIKGNDTYEQIISIFNNLINPIVENNFSTSFFQASSSEMFDSSELPLDENSKLKARSPYAKGKLYVHESIQKIKSIEKINISSGIMFNHESEFRDDEYLIMKIINSAIQINEGNKNELKIGSLNLTRDWSYAEDVANAIYKININNTSEDYVIGSGIGNNIENILEIVFTYFDLYWKDFITVDPSLLRSGDPVSIIAKPSKINENLDWKTETTLKDLIIKCIEYKTN
tara:strand:+ start:2548 stop:3522 length:975 start_codon:yes stop_codon:yes gene_type:complete